MSYAGYFKLLPAIAFLCSCTFGEGPELVLPESDDAIVSTYSTNDTTPVAPIVVQPQEVIAQPVEAQNTTTAIDAPVAQGSPTESAEVIGSNTEESELAEPSDGIAEPSEEQDNIVRIPRTDRANAPVIDGGTIDYIGGSELLDGEWRFAAQFNAAGEALRINQFMFGNADQALSGSYHHWAAMHDGEYLYLAVIVDDNGLHFQDSNEDRKLWKDDSVELFFDGNNSKLAEYDGVDDFHLTVNLLTAEIAPNNSYGPNSRISKSDQSATLPSDLLFQSGVG